MIDPVEKRLLILRSEWHLAREAGDLQRSAWVELHGRWLIRHLQAARDALKDIRDMDTAFPAHRFLDAKAMARAALREIP